MPYIDKASRTRINPLMHALSEVIQTEGELNYTITRLVMRYLLANGALGLSYRSFNAVMGVLSCVAREIYRRVGAPYEDFKAHENGDIPEFQEVQKIVNDKYED